MTTKPYHTLSKRFEELDRLIRPTDKILNAAREAHLDVRKRINNDAFISEVHVADFLQGSYARHTMVKPPLDDYGEPQKADVDIILVTRVSEQMNPQHVLENVKKWLEHEYGKGSAEVQSRSVKLSMADVEVDLVPTSAPSEAEQEALMRYAEKAMQIESGGDPNDVLDPEEVFGPQGGQSSTDGWRDEPLRIPDVYAACWQDTHPLATLEFTVEKNKLCDKRFLATVRALKWWRRKTFLDGGQKHPKSYPVEHMAGDHCPPGISSVAEGLTFTLEGMRDTYAPHFLRSVPHLFPRGLQQSEANVLSRLSQEDFDAFYRNLRDAAAIARNAFEHDDEREAALLWQQLLGKEFSVPVLIGSSTKPSTGGYAAPAAAIITPKGGRFG